MRVFDALNDAARQAPAAEAAAESGIDFVPTLMVGPVPESSDPRWLDEARELAALPGTSGICVSDKAGHLTPSALGELVAAVAAATGLPVEVAVRAPGGLAPVSATAAAVAGAASVQAAAGLVALVACRPSAETLRAALVGLAPLAPVRPRRPRRRRPPGGAGAAGGRDGSRRGDGRGPGGAPAARS